MGLLDQLWGFARNQETGEGGDLPRLLLATLGGGESQAAQTQGLGTLIDKFRQAGLGHIAESWISNEQANQPVQPDQVHSALGAGMISELTQKTGMGQGQLLSLLATTLPKLVDAVTPNGQVPTGPDPDVVEHAAGTPAQAPGEAESPRAGRDLGLQQAVDSTDATEPTPSQSG